MQGTSAEAAVEMKAGSEREVASPANAGPRAIGLFLLSTLGISAFFWWLALGVHGSPYYTTGLMWAPALGAMLTLRLQREDFATLSLSGFGGRYALIGYGLPLFYGTVAYSLIWTLGRYALQIFRAERPNFVAGSKAGGTDAEMRAAVLGSSTHYGSLAVDWAAMTLRFAIEDASFPNWRGQVQTRSFSLRDDVLSWKVPPRPDGAVPISVWRRLDD